MIVTRETHPGGCNVFDANGLQWKSLRWVNTETGEADQCVLDANGQKQLDASMKSLLTQKVTLALPVLIVPHSQLPTATHNGHPAPVCPACHHAYPSGDTHECESGN
jgi:hypothetical protein